MTIDMNFALFRKKPLPSNGLKVGIIGAGPAGLSAAGYLACRGYHVEIFDKMPSPGGLLVFGIPDFRMRTGRTSEACDRLLNDFGVIFHPRTKICGGPNEPSDACMHEGDHFSETILSLPDIRSRFDAMLLSTGSWRSRKMNIPGENLLGVYSGLGYLFPQRGAKCGEGEVCCPEVKGKIVAVVGAGLSAVDAVHCALHGGAEQVHMLYRRTVNESPAGAYEIRLLQDRGMELKELAAPRRIIGTAHVEGIEYIQCTLGEPDESGRRCPMPSEGTDTVIPADIVVTAVGEMPTLPDESKLQIKKVRSGGGNWPRMTALEGVFVAGDALTGPSKIGWAITSGLEAAKSMERWIGRDLGSERSTAA
jgi:glutamate synthase (NADPH/NADH) small chain